MASSLLAQRVLAGEPRALARAMSLIEDEAPAAAALVAELFPHSGRAYLIGITGPPGAGKSTLADRLTAEIRTRGLTVGIVAVDPTSPFTGGAILGDRIRMGTHAADPGVFVRSMAARGQLGGLARATADVALVLDAAGRDIVILETVGVGQGEIDVARAADVSVVVLVPGAGDEVQAMKAGIMEIGDLFVVNKADQPGADRAVQAVASALALQPPGPDDWRPPVLKTEATTGAGVPELWEAIARFRAAHAARQDERRRRREAIRLRELAAQRFLCQIEQTLSHDAIERAADAVAARATDPYSAAADLLARVLAGATGPEDAPGGGVARPPEAAPAGSLPRVAREPDLRATSIAWGDLRLTVLYDGAIRLDGGAMFGTVPRVLWERIAPPDDRHRITMAMRPLLVEGPWGRLLVDCGAGDKMSAKARDLYGLDRSRTLDDALAERGLSAADIEAVLATHLHFDHMGGATVRQGDHLVPRFPAARYYIRAGEWDDATHPHERNRASYLADDFVPLREAGVVVFTDGDETIRPGVRVVRTGGHTAHHQIVVIESGGRTAVFVADLIPTTAHVPDPWIMGYDLFPVETLMFKKRFIREAIDHEYLIVFEHDPYVAAGYIREAGGRRWVEQVL